MVFVKVSGKEIAAIIRCANMGLTQGQAAELTLLSPTTISRAATKYGIRFQTYRENEDGRNARGAKVSAKNKATDEPNDRKQQETKQVQPHNAARRNPSSSYNDRKKARKELAIEQMILAETPSEKREESVAQAMSLAKVKQENATAKIREKILGCFTPGEDLTARQVSQKLNRKNIEMTAQSVNGFISAMATAGKLERYRGPSGRYDRSYWHYYLPQEPCNE